ncbi:hypothetical protein NXV24_26185 [Bacteroides thetaiotaomicron]|nr:alpha-N-acetylglucosaminidase TIM-barrel domain-containing protein [Bacteroides thetaiotaomicron]MCS2399783.1 hypothetical protein [Bacteroides thetaiotaomicron]
MPYWKWSDWEKRLIDWMALNGCVMHH